MSKAMLIIDMPGSCDRCPLFCGHYSDMCCRGLDNRPINYPYPKENRQEWCPLKLIPVKDETWILCSERLPEEPDIQFQALNFFPKYNVTIDGAEKSTTLHYLGDGEWSDAEGNSYNVIAWQQLPKAYCLEESKNSNRTFSGKV